MQKNQQKNVSDCATQSLMRLLREDGCDDCIWESKLSGDINEQYNNNLLEYTANFLITITLLKPSLSHRLNKDNTLFTYIKKVVDLLMCFS